MDNSSIEIEIADFQDANTLTELQQFWYAVLSFNALEFYVLLHDNINLYGHTKQSFTEKLHRKMSAHQFYGDHEYILVLDKKELEYYSFINCDFMGCVNTGFSTKLKFELANNIVVGISFIEDEYDIEKVFDLYSLDDLMKRVFDRNMN